MPKTISYVALAAALTIAGPCLAQGTPATSTAQPPSASPSTPAAPTREAAPQTAAPQTAAPPSAAPPASAPSTSAPTSAAPAASAPTGASTDTAANAGASTLSTGMSVKDNTGAIIGEVKSIKGTVATIAMGSDTFSVDTDKLGLSGGAATINATQAELKKMLPPKK